MTVIEAVTGKAAAERPIEVVERKGLGHPDSICDAVMDAISVALSQVYLQEFGTILHHNIDKGLLAAGQIERRFGGGRVVRPMELVIGDRATAEAGGKKIPVAELAVETAKSWFRDHMRFVDPDEHLTYRVTLAPGSEELAGIFARPGEVMGANDTSAAVGYYPLSPTEQLVLDLEKHLNSEPFKTRFPETGEDVKVMGVRANLALDLTVAMPLLAQFVDSEGRYFERKAEISEELVGFVRQAGLEQARIHFNALDREGRGLGGIYLSVLGTSAEDADSGQVGRGNRVNGLIAVTRPLGTEAAAGKNPVSHVGKIYNVLAHRTAREIYENVEGIKEARVVLVSRIGAPVDRPALASARILTEEGIEPAPVVPRAEEIVERELRRIGGLCMELSQGKHPIC